MCHERRISALQRLTRSGDEQPTQVREPAFDVSKVGAQESLGIDDRVVDPYLESLADQPLRQLDVRAFPQVVGVHLEAQSEHGDRPERAGDQPIHDVGDDRARWSAGCPRAAGRPRTFTRAMSSNARKSFGRQEPPKANPGLR